MRHLRRLLGYARPYAWRLILSTFFGIFVGIFSAGTVGSLVPLVNVMFRDGAFIGDGKAIERIIPQAIEYLPPSAIDFLSREVFCDRQTALGYSVLFLLVVSALNGICRFVQQYLGATASFGAVRDLRDHLYAHVQSLSLRFHGRTQIGEMISRFTNDASLVRMAIKVAFDVTVREPFRVIGYLAALFFFGGDLAIFALVVFPAAAAGFSTFGRRVKRYASRRAEKVAAITSIVQETLMGIRVVKAFVMEKYERKRFDRESQELYRFSVKAAVIEGIAAPVMEFLGTLGMASLLYLGGRKVTQGLMTPGDLIAFVVALVALFDPIKQLFHANNHIQKGIAGAERVFRTLDEGVEVVDDPNAEDLPSPDQGCTVTFRNVSFWYEPGAEVLSEITLKADRGRVIAIVGPTGSGKSTLVNLIPRFYDVACGKIEVNGRDIRRLRVASLRSAVGIVPQETMLFHDTVRANIAYGRPEATDAEIEDAARQANIHGFLAALPEGYATVVGSQGTRLSGGERQRIAIARALLKDPPMLILDEATSSLDAETEALVQEALDRLMTDRTTFVIAHRLSTVRRADVIIVLEGGRIVERGSHDELLATGGLYARLHAMQFEEAQER